MIAQLATFLGISALVICTPGQDTALTIRNTLLGGRRAGLLTALGVSSGQAVWAVATSVGLAAVLVASEPVFATLKLAGSAYLVYLGLHAIRRALTGAPEAARRGQGSPAAAYRQGLLSNLGNPKMAVFFTSLLPQFAPGGAASFPVLLGLGLVFCALTLAWLSGYAVLVDRVGDVLRTPRVRRLLDAVLGAVLVALGLRLAAERR